MDIIVNCFASKIVIIFVPAKGHLRHTRLGISLFGLWSILALISCFHFQIFPLFSFRALQTTTLGWLLFYQFNSASIHSLTLFPLMQTVLWFFFPKCSTLYNYSCLSPFPTDTADVAVTDDGSRALKGLMMTCNLCWWSCVTDDECKIDWITEETRI